MKYIQAMLAVVCLLIVGGAIGAARADDREERKHQVTLYTPQGRGDLHACTGFNVSDKTLGLTFEIVDQDGQAVSCDSPNTCSTAGTPTMMPTPTTNPTPEFDALPGIPGKAGIIIQRPIGSGREGYCAVVVSGTGNRDDVRAVLKTLETRTIPGTTIPVLTFGGFEAH
jgi:hypothetical protein